MKFSHCISLLLGLLTLFSVDMMISQVPVAESATCYHINFDVWCDASNITAECAPTCTRRCGQSTALCTPKSGTEEVVCACAFQEPDCTTQRRCHDPSSKIFSSSRKAKESNLLN
ncbi:OLC1v1019508C1 [Oldenlandia corymbosa var. corymbosa]|uniref:OLC1v1019508C1 n=1 Tax=Oldenlandia corymbosa var. corymbosa TaxID=529605 RepID=A0AAV1EE97_OLDCO|nr:OLC1v1019508C1 [Oldenlandia corymbosa var. corymbosa]